MLTISQFSFRLLMALLLGAAIGVERHWRQRMAGNLPAYAGALTTDALIDELLVQRRYSLFYEGHRWIDTRRYGRLNQLPLDQPGQTIFDAMPRPIAEVNWGNLPRYFTPGDILSKQN
jgi:hypothetical protein